jgi:TPP-dependent pyruvate/acetoin dehydrogenase alpha subunit
MNLASLYDVPVLLCCENNEYGMGTSVERARRQRALTGPHVQCLRALRGSLADGLHGLA